MPQRRRKQNQTLTEQTGSLALKYSPRPDCLDAAGQAFQQNSAGGIPNCSDSPCPAPGSLRIPKRGSEPDIFFRIASQACGFPLRNLQRGRGHQESPRPLKMGSLPKIIGSLTHFSGVMETPGTCADVTFTLFSNEETHGPESAFDLQGMLRQSVSLVL